MQKQKINYLALQSTYSSVDLALFENQQCISFVQISKFTASSELIPAVKTSLAEHSMPLKELDFICANLGPAPFTTLRTTIVTVNGLGFATQIPLVGVNGLEAFAKTVLPENNNLIIVLNAFSKSIYYAIRRNNLVTYGWQMLDTFLNKIADDFQSQPVVIIGEGIANYQLELASLPSNFTISTDCPGYPSINLIAQTGLILFENKITTHELSPLYLKQAEPLLNL